MLTRFYCSLENQLHSFLHRVKQDQRGITAIEYAALAVGLSALIIKLTTDGGEISTAIKDAFGLVTEKLKSVK